MRRASCECGHLVPTDELHYLNDDDDEGYCDSCYHDHGERQVIQSYYFKPEPIFYGEGNRFFGVELEMDEGGERDSKARQILDVANGNGLEQEDFPSRWPTTEFCSTTVSCAVPTNCPTPSSRRTAMWQWSSLSSKESCLSKA